MRLGCVDDPASQKQVSDVSVSNSPPQKNRHERRHEAKLDLRVAEFGLGDRDSEIGQRGDPASAGNGRAVDGSDHRPRKAVEPIQQFRDSPCVLEILRQRLPDGMLEFVLVPASRSETGADIVLTQADLSNLLSAKAAIYAGTEVLARAIGLDFREVERVYIAGGFGNYLDREKALAIGLIPDLPLEKIRFAGNTSILGADLGLLSEDAWQELHAIAEAVTYYDLINYPKYYDEFLAAKFIPHTDLSRFKSVQHSQEVEAWT